MALLRLQWRRYRIDQSKHSPPPPIGCSAPLFFSNILCKQCRLQIFQHSGDELTLEILCVAEVDVRSADKQPFFPKVDFSHQPFQCEPRRLYITLGHRLRVTFFSLPCRCIWTKQHEFSMLFGGDGSWCMPAKKFFNIFFVITAGNRNLLREARQQVKKQKCFRARTASTRQYRGQKCPVLCKQSVVLTMALLIWL